MEMITGPVDLRESGWSASRVLMVRPRAFARNEAAAASNSFMNEVGDPAGKIARAAMAEFDGLVGKLEAAGVRVVVAEDLLDLPDSVFPNNWISFHEPREGGGGGGWGAGGGDVPDGDAGAAAGAAGFDSGVGGPRRGGRGASDRAGRV
jgi:hypothetical protein